jgi:hypothetical protein
MANICGKLRSFSPQPTEFHIDLDDPMNIFDKFSRLLTFTPAQGSSRHHMAARFLLTRTIALFGETAVHSKNDRPYRLRWVTF